MHLIIDLCPPLPSASVSCSARSRLVVVIIIIPTHCNLILRRSFDFELDLPEVNFIFRSKKLKGNKGIFILYRQPGKRLLRWILGVIKRLIYLNIFNTYLHY